MRVTLHWTALLLGILAVALVAAEAALRLRAKYVTKRDRLFWSDAQTGWRTAPNLLTTRINAAGGRLFTVRASIRVSNALVGG